MIISCIQSKGGNAKTTTSVNLSHALTMHKQKVLLIDLDSQGSASLSLGVPRGELNPSIAEVLIEDMPIEDAIRETTVENLHIITGSMALANFDVNMADKTGRTDRIKEVLKSINQEYDTVILDCPPTLSLLPVNALVACDRYLVPVQPHYLALEGLVNLLSTIDRIKGGIGSEASLLGILLTLVDARARVNTVVSRIAFRPAIHRAYLKERSVMIRESEFL